MNNEVLIPNESFILPAEAMKGESALISDYEYQTLLANDFGSFIQQCFYTVAAGTTWLPNWHIDLIASKLEDCRLGKIRRLIITIPPRNLKSICTSVAFPAWLLAHDPTTEIICASYAQDLSVKHAMDTRSVMQADWYRSIFPARLDPRKSAADAFMTTKGGTRIATSVGGTLTGRGGNFLIIDDPLKPCEAVSDTRRNQVNQWYANTLYSRLNDKVKGCIIIIMQRLHEDDLVGYVLEKEGWEVVSLPAIAETREVHRYNTFFGEHSIIRQPGDLLHPQREPKEVMDRMRQTLGEYNFAGQYQQQPAPLAGGLIKSNWFRRYSALPGEMERIVQSWDTANKPTELADYSVCTTWGLYKGNYYLLDVLREKLEFPQLRRAVVDQSQRWHPKTVLIEDKASGTSLIQDLKQQVRCIHAVTPEGDKIMRMHAQTAVIENGMVFIPEDSPWLAAFLHETSCFPNGRHDDQVDSLSQFLNWAEIAKRYVGPQLRRL